MPENMTSTPSYTIETDSVIASGDACTLEMLGNQNFSLVSQQAVTRNCDSLRKAVEHGMIFDNIVLLQPSLHVFDFVTTDTLLDESEVAQIILFIHNKDGKK